MRFLGLMLLGALGLGGCAKSPVLDANDLAQDASEYVAIYNDLDNWDEARVPALFGTPSRMANQREHMKWMHAQVGDCGDMQLMWQRGSDRGRFSFLCERGGLEVSLGLDATGRIDRVISGTVGVAPTPAVARALDEVLAAMPWQESVAGQKPWGERINSRWIRSRGRCELERVRTISETIGVFDLRCEKGGMYVWIEVNKAGEIRTVRVWRPEDDEARAWRRQPMG